MYEVNSKCKSDKNIFTIVQVIKNINFHIYFLKILRIKCASDHIYVRSYNTVELCQLHICRQKKTNMYMAFDSFKKR